MHARTHARKIFTQYSGISSCSLGSTDSLLSDHALPTSPVDEQYDDHNETVNNINELKIGVLNGTIPSAFADSGATSNVGTTKDRNCRAFIATGRQSDKAFRMPNGSVEEATTLDALQHSLRAPARDIHIVPSIECVSQLSVSKFVVANYIVIFDKDEVKIFDANNTEITVLRAAILRGWRCPDTKLWCIPLVKHVTNANTDTILCDRPPSEFLPEQPPPTEAVVNVYELKMQLELIRYYHAAAGFPTKPTWVTAIKNCQFASWPGLTAKAATKHFPESKETTKGHG